MFIILLSCFSTVDHTSLATFTSPLRVIIHGKRFSLYSLLNCFLNNMVAKLATNLKQTYSKIIYLLPCSPETSPLFFIPLSLVP